ncbi:ADP-ribosylglycohydrolase family protein [Nocardia sp. NPDC024068]|uniref:ADP-ribosylglycohydrolase family protein n=1 Tax=Nocardia sp. NPDC024068 TaxID=3157197 RepID=UPI0033D0FE7C
MDDYRTLVDRIRGTLVGGAIGDALGWPIEFRSLTDIRNGYGDAGITGFLPGPDPAAPQQITDDTQMTLFTAEGLLRCPPGHDPVPVLRRAYLRWLATQEEPRPPGRPDGWLAGLGFLYAVRAPGNACMSGLRRQSATYLAPQPFGEPGPVNAGSKGCGTVMRSAPFGLVAAGARVAFETAARCGQLTHGHPTGYLAAGALGALVDRLVTGSTLAEALSETGEILGAAPGARETIGALARAGEQAAAGPATPERVEQVGQGWIAEECLAVAVYCALHAERTGDVRGALLLAVNHSGDSDSTGAVAGNLLGARHGLAALPSEWVESVEGRDVAIQVADDLAVGFHYGERQRLGGRYPLDTAPAG